MSSLIQKALLGSLAVLLLTGIVEAQPPEASMWVPLPNSPPMANVGSEMPTLPDAVPVTDVFSVLLGQPWVYTADAEFMLWLTQSERSGRALSLRGPATIPAVVPLGNTNRSSNPIPGGRFNLGAWIPDRDPLLSPDLNLFLYGGEVNFYFMGERAVDFRARYKVPNLADGEIYGKARFDMWGLELNGRCNVYSNPPGQLLRLDFIGGLRHMQFQADLNAVRNTRFNATINNFPDFQDLAGTQVDQTASYRASNAFYGGQIGLATHFFPYSNILVGGDFRVALGSNVEKVSVNGLIQTNPNRPAALARESFLADIGSNTRCRFAYIPEVNLYAKIGLCHGFSAYMGYSLFYWSHVARAADQIDVEQVGSFRTSTEVIRERGMLLHAFYLGLEKMF